MKSNIIVSTIVGKPNAGKSSLLNNIIGYDFSIVTEKAQTTRDQITGIYNDEEKNQQFIFIDTPGINKPNNELGEKLNEFSFASFKDVDLIIFATPADELLNVNENSIIEKILKYKHKIAVITKIDKVKDFEIIDTKAKKLKELGFDSVIAFSIHHSNTREILLNEIAKYSYLEEKLYEDDYYTDKSMRFIAKELIRKAAIEILKQEVPHNIAVMIDSYVETKDEDHKTQIEATIYVIKDSHKGILIGKNGVQIKDISQRARKYIEEFLDEKIVLLLKVKVNKDWVNSKEQLKKMEY